MARYHLSPNVGPARCSANIQCEFADAEGNSPEHYPNKAAAEKAWSERLEKKYGRSEWYGDPSSARDVHPDLPMLYSSGKGPTPWGDVSEIIATSDAPFQTKDIEKVESFHASYHDDPWVLGHNGGTELSLAMIGKLKDGRYFSVSGGNDYTGWGCLGDRADYYIGETREDVIRYGVDMFDSKLLGVRGEKESLL